ncbi:MAG: NAD-dependent protein deacylase [Bacteroidales bacterium]|nr:NAD-dependent protein deacylase [Bacteroidales bacterium]
MDKKKNLVVLSGSGISAESGISTFRGGNGLWDNVPVEEICTPEGWRRNPAKVLRFYNERRAQLAQVEPNEAHRIVSEMERDFNVCVITQNVDNLHERAGSSRVLHLHGELTKVRPEDCYNDMDGYSEKYVQDIGYKQIELGDTGGRHGRQLRPHIVWFGEAVPNLEKAAALVSVADILLIIGTSMQVYPAASLYHYAPDSCQIWLIDPDARLGRQMEASGIHVITDIASSGMRRFREAISGK